MSLGKTVQRLVAPTPHARMLDAFCRMLVGFHTLGIHPDEDLDLIWVVVGCDSPPRLWVHNGGRRLRVVRPSSRTYCLMLLVSALKTENETSQWCCQEVRSPPFCGLEENRIGAFNCLRLRPCQSTRSPIDRNARDVSRPYLNGRAAQYGFMSGQTSE
jgi:hypothetical protein